MRAGYSAAVAVRELAYVALFLPLVGMPAFLWTAILQLWNLVTAPVRFVSRMWARLTPRPS